jgi:hypothetical protein
MKAEDADNIASSSDEENGQLTPTDFAEVKVNHPLNMDPPKDCLVIFDNPEKGGRVRLGEAEYMPMSSSRVLLSGPPGSGKRSIALNLIMRMKPKPTVVHLVHCDENTIEYDCIADAGIPIIGYSPSAFPTLKNIEEPDLPIGGDVSEDDEEKRGEKKPLSNPLVIVDECTTEQLGKVGSHRFERLVNHIATHRNCTVICSIQSLTNIPAKCRRAFNHIALWRQADKSVDQMAAVRAGIPYDTLRDFFGLCNSPYDFIWVDLDSNHDSPWRYRLNFISPIIITKDCVC